MGPSSGFDGRARTFPALHRMIGPTTPVKEVEVRLGMAKESRPPPPHRQPSLASKDREHPKSPVLPASSRSLSPLLHGPLGAPAADRTRLCPGVRVGSTELAVSRSCTNHQELQLLALRASPQQDLRLGCAGGGGSESRPTCETLKPAPAGPAPAPEHTQGAAQRCFLM